jgi:hypothetical protein
MAVEWSLPNRDCAMTLKNQPASPSDPFPRKFLAHTPYPRAFVRTLCNHRELAQDIATPAGPQHWALELSDARVARGRPALAAMLDGERKFHKPSLRTDSSNDILAQLGALTPAGAPCAAFA